MRMAGALEISYMILEMDSLYMLHACHRCYSIYYTASSYD